MDTTASYREAVKETIQQYAKLRPSHGDIRLDPVFDDAKGRYALMQVGWDRGRRVKGMLLYVTVDENSVCIEYDGIEHGIIDDLVRRGVSEDKIETAYMSEATV